MTTKARSMKEKMINCKFTKNVLNFSFQALLKRMKRQTTELGENIFKAYVQQRRFCKILLETIKTQHVGKNTI